jgi:hypothetical protein
MYRAVEPARSDAGRATQSTASLLAALCFLLGIAFAAFAPVSPQERFLVFCFAFAVAIGFYMGGGGLRRTQSGNFGPGPLLL